MNSLGGHVAYHTIVLIKAREDSQKPRKSIQPPKSSTTYAWLYAGPMSGRRLVSAKVPSPHLTHSPPRVDSRGTMAHSGFLGLWGLLLQCASIMLGGLLQILRTFNRHICANINTKKHSLCITLFSHSVNIYGELTASRSRGRDSWVCSIFKLFIRQLPLLIGINELTMFGPFHGSAFTWPVYTEKPQGNWVCW